MAKKTTPAIRRRFHYRHNPADTMPEVKATAEVEARPAMDEAETQAFTYAEQKAEAERKAGRKVSRVVTRRAAVLHYGGVSPHRRLNRLRATDEVVLHRIFIFK